MHIRFALPFVLSAILALPACTPRSGGGGGGGGDNDEPIPEEPSEWADNGYPSLLEENEDYVGEGTGQRREFMQAWNLVDQNGNHLDFRQLLGFAVLVDVSAEWCGPCRQAAEHAQELSDEIQALGSAYYVQIIAQDYSGNSADQATAERWADDFDLQMPVLADEGEEVSAAWQLRAFPTFFFVAPTGEIVDREEGFGGDERLLAYMDYIVDDYEDDLREMEHWPGPPEE